MDDYTLSSLTESKNEWSIRLVNVITPPIIEGIRSIFNEALELCQQNKEDEQYLLTFQTFLARIPKWNNNIIDEEVKRIEDKSKCGYLEELISCVHVIQLKALTCVRVGSKQKKIDIEIPSVNQFIHKVYINVARTLYTNVYLFQHDLLPLDIQKNNREFENIVKESVLNAIRDTMPIENILKAYMDETEELETNIQEEVLIEPMQDQDLPTNNTTNDATTNDATTNDTTTNDTTTKDTTTNDATPDNNVIANITTPVEEHKNSKIDFSDIDHTIDTLGNKDTIDVPKTQENLDRLETERELNAIDDDDDDENSLTIGEDVSLDITDINDLNKPMNLDPPEILDEIEVLE